MSAAMNNSPYERIQVVRLAGNSVADAWQQYGPWIMATMEHDLEPVDALEVMSRLRGDNYICLEALIDGESAGIAICAIAYLGDGRSLEVKALAGDNFDVWFLRMWCAIKETAESQGLRRVFIKGRLGWQKKLKSIGFKARAITMEFDLNG